MNRVLKRILEKIIDQSRKYWSMKLEEALRAYRTSFKTLIAFSPCQLVYDKVCHLLVKLGHKVLWAMKLLTMDSSLVGLKESTFEWGRRSTGSMHTNAHDYTRRNIFMRRRW